MEESNFNNEPQMNNQNNIQTNNNKSSNGLLVVLIILVLVLIGVVVYAFILKPTDKKEDNKPISNTTTVEDNKKTTGDNNQSNQEVEVSINDYKYLVERLNFVQGDCTCKEFPMVDKIDNNSIVNTALYNLSDQQEKITIKKDDSLYNELYKKYSGTSQLTAYDVSTSSLIFRSVKIDKVKNKITEIFGDNFNYTFESFYGNEKSSDSNYKCSKVYYEYVKELNSYLLLENASCGGGPETYTSSISKITKQDKKINIYIKFTGSSIDNEYKYTFEKEDNNYIIKKLEKIK